MENLIVARARISGGVALEREAPAEVRVGVGDEIVVKVPYRFDEVGNAREDYKVLLRTRVDSEPPDEQRVVAKDQAGRSDARRGVVMRRMRLLAAGQHVLAYEVHVVVERTPWQGGETVVEEAEVAGTVRVHVR